MLWKRTVGGSKSLGYGVEYKEMMFKLSMEFKAKGRESMESLMGRSVSISWAHKTYQLNKTLQNEDILIFPIVSCGSIRCKHLYILGISSLETYAWLSFTQMLPLLVIRETQVEYCLFFLYLITVFGNYLLHWNMLIVLIPFAFLGILS